MSDPKDGTITAYEGLSCYSNYLDLERERDFERDLDRGSDFTGDFDRERDFDLDISRSRLRLFSRSTDLSRDLERSRSSDLPRDLERSRSPLVLDLSIKHDAIINQSSLKR